MRSNSLKVKLQSGLVASGIVMTESSPAIIEILALVGFDFVFIDCEHSALSVETVQNLVTAAELRGTTPLVRPPMNVAEVILRYMDTGAGGMIIPGMDCKKAAQAAVRAVKYPPLGERGLGGSRAADYGLSGPLGDYVEKANQETMVFGMVESGKAVKNIEEILETEGLDGIFIGSNDLSNSLGVAGQTAHPTVVAAVDKVLEAGKAAGKPIGGIVRGGETPQEYISKGYKMPTTSVCGLLAGAARHFIKNANG